MRRPRRESARARGWCCCLLTGAGCLALLAVGVKGEDKQVNMPNWTVEKSEEVLVLVVVVVGLACWPQGWAEADRKATKRRRNASSGKGDQLDEAKEERRGQQQRLDTDVVMVVVVGLSVCVCVCVEGGRGG